MRSSRSDPRFMARRRPNDALGRWLRHRPFPEGTDPCKPGCQLALPFAQAPYETLDPRQLGCLAHQVNQEYFQGERKVPVMWGRYHRRRRPPRSLQLGSYDPQRRRIRIHPVLSQYWVPQYVLAFVIFHEFLHDAVPPERVGRRTVFHTRRFRELERRHPDYQRVKDWEERYLGVLLRSVVTFGVA